MMRAAEGTVMVRHATNRNPGSFPLFDRRIGHRHRVTLNGIAWRPRLPRNWFGRSPRWQRATITDLSLTGARLRAPANDGIQRGTEADVAFGRHHGVVQVRRVDPAHDPAVAYYGVRFVSLDPIVERLIHDTVVKHQSEQRP